MTDGQTTQQDDAPVQDFTPVEAGVDIDQLKGEMETYFKDNPATEAPKTDEGAEGEPAEKTEEPEAPATETTVTPAAPKADWLNPDLELLAAQAGIAQTDAVEFGSAQALRKAIGMLQGRAPRQNADAPATTDKPVVTEPALKIELDPAKYDDDIIKQFDNIQKHFSDEVNKLKERNAVLENSAAQVNGQAKIARFDGFIAGLGDDFQPLLGKGGVDAVDQKSDHFKNREKLFSEMQALAAGYGNVGMPVPPEAELFRKALHSTFGDQIQKIANGKLRNTVERRAKQIIAPPTHQSSNESVSDEDKAVAAVTAEMKKKGYDA